MPIYRHQCRVCGEVREDIFSIGAPNPDCHGKRTKRLMPKRVVGRVVGDSDGVHTGSGFAAPTASSETASASWRPENRQVSQPIDTADPTVIAPAPATGVFAKPYEDCSADERDSRWRDSAESVSAWMVRHGEAKGMSPSAARTEANQAAQETIAKSREDNSREDGLT